MLKEVLVPDIGSYSNVDIIEISVAVGDLIKADETLMILETEKATLEVPAPFAGVVKTVHVKVGDKVSEGSLIVTLDVGEDLSNRPAEIPSVPPLSKGGVTTEKPTDKDTSVGADRRVRPASELEPTSINAQNIPPSPPVKRGIVHAGPGVRRFARELGADLSRIGGSGPKNRILKADVQIYIKSMLSQIQSGNIPPGGGGISVAPWPQVDFAKFGEVSKEPLSRIKKLSGSFLHRNWVMVPHITQFDEADITELEQFRKAQQSLAEAQGVKLTPLVFIMKAVVATLKEFPWFNASLDANGAELILKKYFHMGVAVDTPNGLVVPVVRDVDQKGLFQLAKELGEISQKARAGQLTAQEMQGSSFTISSLGGIGGTAFTPIINVPDVAILGVSKAQIKPVYESGEFKPRLLLPLSLSYDHRVIDGALGARFITFLVKQLSDIRRLLL
jgi:pyruvate dehydrogenase E2 component (dihydrolipoamide acetyltransferase)